MYIHINAQNIHAHMLKIRIQIKHINIIVQGYKHIYKHTFRIPMKMILKNCKIHM